MEKPPRIMLIFAGIAGGYIVLAVSIGVGLRRWLGIYERICHAGGSGNDWIAGSSRGDAMTAIATREAVNDTDLVAASRQGDREAFGRIVRKYQGLVSGLIYSACGDLSASEDIAQETFLAAWKSLSGLREPQKLAAGFARLRGIGCWIRIANQRGRMPGWHGRSPNMMRRVRRAG